MVQFASPIDELENTLEKINNYLKHYKKDVDNFKRSKSGILREIEHLEKYKSLYENAIEILKIEDLVSQSWSDFDE